MFSILVFLEEELNILGGQPQILVVVVVGECSFELQVDQFGDSSSQDTLLFGEDYFWFVVGEDGEFEFGSDRWFGFLVELVLSQVADVVQAIDVSFIVVVAGQGVVVLFALVLRVLFDDVAFGRSTFFGESQLLEH